MGGRSREAMGDRHLSSNVSSHSEGTSSAESFFCPVPGCAHGGTHGAYLRWKRPSVAQSSFLAYLPGWFGLVR